MAAASHMHNLTTLIKRLEAATSRLEDIATSTELPKDVGALALPGGSSSAALTPDASSSAATPRSAPQPPVPEELPESIDDFDAFVDSAVADYVRRSNDIGGLVARQAADVLAGFRAQRKFLLITTKAVRPDIQGADMALYQDLLKPINDSLMAVTELKEANRSDPLYTQLSAVADGIMVLAWVTVSHKPFTHVEEFLGSAQFFGNRVIKEYKDKDPKQVEWIQSFYQIFKQLRDYVKQYFATGIPWNPKGEPAAAVVKALDSAPNSAAPAPPTRSAGGPPPPPPPPGPAPVLDVKTENVAPAAPAPTGGLGAVFSELNKGDAVTKGLRKVDKSQMTHKNPALRTDTKVPSSGDRPRSPAPGKKPKPESMRMKKPPKKILEGNKWIIENYEKEPQPIEIQAELNHSILISRCHNTTIIVRGKANQVTVENASRLSLVVDTLVSTVDVVKAQNFALQVLGTIPTVMMDQVDSAQIYFSKASTGTQIFHSKSDGINLNVIAPGPDEDYKEVPLPSQMCTYYDAEKGDLVNEIVAHAG
ncbi:adenylyl cyclase-associated protein [Cordyceps militaris CM01]|uniref:Adenylyl cyclase-associated protein n=2 Tax=Cordyceps militaris TaxID=73501 RepID=G3JCP6_CORMM|nr:adenylyl cyclase-associated protein [Cordyceps militaris CM01]ATY59965.1 adenylyl cyclase-associated [Cordyceps militaris]EGX94654.1 adenylyl cyclase-associated protein [Cordyceps militaris CM01]